MATEPEGENLEPLAEEVVELLALAKSGKAERLEAAWMAAVENPERIIEEFQMVLEQVAARKVAAQMESLVWLFLSAQSEREGPEAALDAAWQMRSLLPDSDALRDEIGDLYRRVHADLDGIETLAAMTVLRRDLGLADAMGAMERMLALPPGTYVSDSRRRSPGRVTGPDAARKVLAVSFGESERAYDAASVEALETLEPDDFRAMAVFDRPGLAAVAEADPARLVRLVLRAYGPRTGMKDLKARLADVAVPADGWSRWWSSAKAQVKRDPLIEMSEGTQPDFFLRSRPMTYEAEVRDRFEVAAATEERLAIALGYLGEAGHNPAAEAELLGWFTERLAPMTDEAGRAAPAEALGALAVLARIRKHLGDTAAAEPPLPAALATDRAALAAALAATRSDNLAAAMLVYVHESLPAEWPEVFAAAMPGASQETCERIAADLASAGLRPGVAGLRPGEAGRQDLLAAAAATIMRQPNQSVAALAWLWKTAASGKYPEALGDLSRPSITIRLLAAANEVALTPTADKARQHDLLTQVRRTISARDFAILHDILDHTDAGWAKEIRTAVQRNSGLTEHLRVQILDVLAHSHPVPLGKIAAPWEDEGVVYTTEAALEARRREFDNLLHVKLPQNSTAIGEAAARGDLSENAEFTAALEERDRLTERANAMQADLTRARPITHAMAHSETVNVGSAVRARRLSSGEVEEMAFLGPWDADTQKGIYYYRAPMAQAFMGRAAGEVVTLKTDGSERQWEILEIGPAI